MLQAILYTLFQGWNLISGYNGNPADYHLFSNCTPSIIWNIDSEGTWRAWYPELETEPLVRIVDYFDLNIDWMYPENGYWVYCKEISK